MDEKEIRKQYTQRMQQKKIQEALKKKPTKSFDESVGFRADHRVLANRVIRNNKQRKSSLSNHNIIHRKTVSYLSAPLRNEISGAEMELPDWLKFTGKAEVSVIIPLYKSNVVLQDLIKSIPNSHSFKVEYIFVDDCCPNNSKDFVLPLFTKRKNDTKNLARVVHTNKNKGYGQACNVGAKFATGEYLIFLNADTELTDNWLKPIMELLISDSKIGIVGNMQLKHGTDTIDSAGSEWSPESSLFLHIGRDSYQNKSLNSPFKLQNAPKELLEISEREMVTGCCFGISKKLFDYVGGFNPNYMIGYWEDTEICMTVKELGYKIMFQPNSIIYHKGQHTRSGGHPYHSHNWSYFKNKWINSDRINNLLLSKQKVKKNNPKNILIVRRNSNGDLLIASSVCYPLKQKYPDCNITFATIYPDCLEENPYIDKIIPYNEFQKVNFDVIYNLDQINDWRPHTSIKNVFAEAVGVRPEDCQCTMKVSKPKTELPEDYIVVHPGESDWAGRNWPHQNWQEITKKLLEANEKVIVVGKFTEKSIPCTLELIGNIKSSELAYIIKKATMFIGIDSFPLHVAQEQDTPGIAFFGSVAPEAIITNKKIRSISASNLPCISCHRHSVVPINPVMRCKIGTRECETKVTVDDMWQAIQKYLKEIRGNA